MGKLCTWCHVNKPSIKRPKTGALICKDCFFVQFEDEIHQTITQANLFRPGQKVAIAASGGKGMHPTPLGNPIPLLLQGQGLHRKLKLTLQSLIPNSDSTVLAHVMTTLNKRHNYGLELFLLSIDEGIVGYRDDSLEVRKNASFLA